MKNKKDYADYIYASFMKAEKYLDRNIPDSKKRNPKLSENIILKFSQKSAPCVAVTGSKGKGSVSNFISAIMQTEIKTGLMTSPHLIKFNERIKINDKDISDENIERIILDLKPQFDEIEKNLTEKEFISPMAWQGAAALEYFNENNTEFNIFELGKGAKYDDINNIPHDYSVINPIFLEHTRELGKTISEIALNKAEIIKSGQKCCYISEQFTDAEKIIENRCNSVNVKLKKYGKDFYADNIIFLKSGMKFDVYTNRCIYKDITIPLLGTHQVKNCALAFAICEDFLGKLNIEKCRENLIKINWPGRLEVISSEPFIIADATINRESIDLIKETLFSMNINKIISIIGIPDDKDFFGVAEKIKDISEKIIITKCLNPYYIFTDKQKDTFDNANFDVITSENIYDALKKAEKFNLPICIMGTTGLISDVQKLKNNYIK